MNEKKKNADHELQKEVELLRAQLETARDEIARLKGRRIDPAEYEAARKKAQAAEFSLKKTSIEFLKRGTNPKYPDSYFSILILPEADRTMAEIEAEAKKAGKGSYMIRSWKQEKGFMKFCGQIELSI